MKACRLCCFVLFLFGLFAGTESVSAHPLAPSLLDLRESGGGRIAALWKRPLLLRVGADPEPLLPERCKVLGPPSEVVDGTAMVRRWTADCGSTGLSGGRIEVQGLAAAGSDVLLRVALADGRTFQSVLRPDAPAFVLPASQSRTDVATSYLSLGMKHLLTGWDHLAFVLGLVLLVPGGRRLLGTITAFTLGHSVTLSLATLGFVRLPSTLLETVIAMTILVLATELMRDHPTVLGRRPGLMAAGFGLIHGLGFAGALAEVGLPAKEIPLALFSFNVGIELGQIAFVIVLLGLGLALRPLRPRLPAWSAAVPAYCIGTCAAFWTFERLALWEKLLRM